MNFGSSRLISFVKEDEAVGLIPIKRNSMLEAVAIPRTRRQDNPPSYKHNLHE
jgi:hypothetical protein